MNEYCSYDRKINATKNSRNGGCHLGPGGKSIGQAQVWLEMVGSGPGLGKGHYD